LIHSPLVRNANTLSSRLTMLQYNVEGEQVWISKQFLRWTSESLSSYITECRSSEKIWNNSGKTSTHRADNIFLKYFIYYVHEIARKYPKKKYRYSSFPDSVVLKKEMNINSGRFWGTVTVEQWDRKTAQWHSGTSGQSAIETGDSVTVGLLASLTGLHCHSVTLGH
jgi:hypothetical protein